jgi:SAM-dependent methyltransferase
MAAKDVLDPRRLLSVPALYQAFQRTVARKNSRARLAREFLKIESGQRVLDVGCGPADIRAYLPDNIDYHGFDMNPRYIASARARFGDRDTFAVRPVSPDAMQDLAKFDIVFSIGVLHHLTDAEVDTVFASAAKVLRPNGRVVTCDGSYVPGQNPIARILLWLDRGRYVRTPNAYLALARRHFARVETTILHDLLSIPYTHCVIEARPS